MSGIKELPVTFGSHGLKLNGKIIIPSNANQNEPVPGAVLCHGFGSAYRVMESSAQIMASQGIATLIFDLRGHGGSEGVVDGKMADDVVDAWNLLSQLPEVDNQRMGLVGHSLGAMSVIMAAERVNNPRALVALACPAETGNQQEDADWDKIGRWGNSRAIVEYPKQGAFPWQKGLSILFCRIWMYLGGFKVKVDWRKFVANFPQMNMSRVLQKLEDCSKLFVFCQGDKVTPYRKFATVYQTACEPKELLLAKGGFHSTPLQQDDLRSQWTGWMVKTLKEIK